MLLANRQEAGRLLAERLQKYRDQNPVVVALPRGGVPVGYEIAKFLGCPLDIMVVRKLGAPHQKELAIGALSDGGYPQQVLMDQILQHLHISKEYLHREIADQLKEIQRREALYRKDLPRVDLAGASVIVVDDGIATGATMEAALKSIQAQAPKNLVLAVPVVAYDTAQRLHDQVDEAVILSAPVKFAAVGAFYQDFRQVEDEEVIALLQDARKSRKSDRQTATL